MPAKPIPKPRKPSRRVLSIDGNSESLAHQMRLDGSKSNRKLYFDIVTGTGILCQEYFPLNERLSGGWNMKPILRILTPKLLKKFPILHDYADHWPITILVARHYTSCRAGSKIGLNHSVSSQPKASKKIVGRTVSTRSMRASALEKGDAGSLPGKLRCSQDSAKCKGKLRDDREASLSPSSSRTLIPEDPSSVVHFLNTLAQDLSDLLPVFIDHGVGGEMQLRNMLRMKNWRAWLFGWVKEGLLTELQFQMIVDGIKKLV